MKVITVKRYRIMIFQITFMKIKKEVVKLTINTGSVLELLLRKICLDEVKSIRNLPFSIMECGSFGGGASVMVRGGIWIDGVPLESEKWHFPRDEELPFMRRTVSNLAVPKTLQKMVIRRITRLSVDRQLDVQVNCMNRLRALQPISETWDLSRQQSRMKPLLKLQEKIEFSTDRYRALYMAGEYEAHYRF
ncbi:hypothetical protein NPIL_358721 [Nephila pilipes]|uniref:Uncharacterized protein n=1 Tax=Nephila pilipes TaxID=299642 RepID=A0A8X6Q0I4_NEPPI|nr:hypothetical protein NPIL_358721 [Nephila pilipes]